MEAGKKNAGAEVSCRSCESLSEALSENVRTRPYTSMALALGTGYILGGGLTSRTTLRVFNLGIKLAMLPFIQEKLLCAADVALTKALRRPGKRG